MTLKMTMMATVLAGALMGGVGQAKADVVGWNVAPPRVAYGQPAPRQFWGQHRRYLRPVLETPAPSYYRRPVAAPVPSYGYGYGYGYGAADAHDPSVVEAEIRAKMERAADDLRFDVRQGVVEVRALASLQADREEIERDLGAAAAKGYLTAEDREHLEQHVQEIRDLRAQFRCARQAQVTYAR
jgi:hypothetical protein